MATQSRSLSTRLVATAGYATLAVVVAAVVPVARRHPVQATAAHAQRYAGTVRHGFGHWLDLLEPPPPPSLGELLFESVLAALLTQRGPAAPIGRSCQS